MENKKNRRSFVKAAALTVAGPVFGETEVYAQDEAQDPLAVAARGLAEIVRARHGKLLTEGQLKNIQLAITRSLASAQVLKRTPLANGDEPAFTFSADVND